MQSANSQTANSERRHPEGARLHQRAEGTPAPQIRTRVTAVIYPEHGTGRAAKLTTCHHCGGKPLVVRRCGRTRSCAVCQVCGYHHRTKLK